MNIQIPTNLRDIKIHNDLYEQVIKIIEEETKRSIQDRDRQWEQEISKVPGVSIIDAENPDRLSAVCLAIEHSIDRCIRHPESFETEVTLRNERKNNAQQ